MALNQMNKLVWIVETIYNAKEITFEQLNRAWMDNVDLSQGEELHKRTFHKWKANILDTFGLIIDCEKTAPFNYHIANIEEIKDGSIGQWLLSTYSISNSLTGCKSIKDRILLENVPSGQAYLTPIIEAMKKNSLIHITYHNYWTDGTKEHYVMPLCVKLFRQRWYLVGRSWGNGYDTIYSLDRIKGFRISSHTFEYPEDFDPKTFFSDCFGVIVGDGSECEHVKLKVSASQANYLRDLPMHDTQKEIERNEKYSIFQLDVKTTYDLMQEVLKNNVEMEVLEPIWFREQIAGIIKDIAEKYK